MITKAHALKLLANGDRTRAADMLGITEKTIANWRTDADGHLIERRVIDSIIAALMRERIMLMSMGKVSPDDPSPVAWQELQLLVALP